MKIKCKRIVGGLTKGKLLFSDQPLNFLAMVDIKTGQIIDINHKLNNQTLKNNILVFPNAIGSSVGAYTIYSLKNNNTSPNGIICTNSADITTTSGCAISNIPLVYIDNKELKKLNNYYKEIKENSKEVILDAENEYIICE
jgi:predicted aconitase with swiveling domain